jgi:hypothetical protein
MDQNIFDELQRLIAQQGPEAGIARLSETLKENKDYGNLFYALLLKKRHELGVSPVPTEASQVLPEQAHEPYEQAIREAGRLVGNLYLEEGDIPRAWVYFRMLTDSEPVARALDSYQFKEEEDPQAVIDIAFHQGVHPRKGFDWILDRFGICSAITMAGSHEFPQAEVREYCIKALVRALYEQLRQRLYDDIAQREGKAPAQHTVHDLMAGRDWLFEDQFYHVDISHLGSVVQMSIHLTPGPELDQARELCAYGRRLSPRFQSQGDPPFEDQYRDFGIYLDVLAGLDVEQGIRHFLTKAEQADPETIGTFPAEVLVNLLVRIGRPGQALEVARRFLTKAENVRLACPSIPELCRLTGNYDVLVEVARERSDPVHFVAGLLAAKK